MLDLPEVHLDHINEEEALLINEATTGQHNFRRPHPDHAHKKNKKSQSRAGKNRSLWVLVEPVVDKIGNSGINFIGVKGKKMFNPATEKDKEKETQKAIHNINTWEFTTH